MENDLFHKRPDDLCRFMPVVLVGQRFVEPRNFAAVVLRHFRVKQRRRLVRRRDQLLQLGLARIECGDPVLDPRDRHAVCDGIDQAVDIPGDLAKLRPVSNERRRRLDPQTQKITCVNEVFVILLKVYFR
jgi:hypothetical protein